METTAVLVACLCLTSLVVPVYSVGEVVDCPQLNGADVYPATMVLLNHNVSEQASSTACMIFQIPSDQDYHLIATKPVMDIDNIDLLEGINLFGIMDDSQVTSQSMSMVSDCSGSEYSASSTLIGYWSKGRNGLCYGDYGFRFGRTSFKYVYIKVFYTNPNMKKTVTDRSGVGVYFKPIGDDTSKDLAIAVVGTTVLEIPPGNASYVVPAYCKGGCTRYMVKDNAKIMGAFGHMGPFGSSVRIEQFRMGMKVADVAYDPYYSYKNVTLQIHSPSLDLMPGDELRTTCVYNTAYTQDYVRWGNAVGEEVCYGFIFAYPRSAIELDYEYCFSYAQLDVCEVYDGNPISTPMGDCDWVSFVNSESAGWVDQVAEYCREDGICSPECKETVKQLLEAEPCLSMEASLFINAALQDNFGHRELAAVNTCRGLIWSEANGQGSDQGDGQTGESCTWNDCAGYCI